MKPYCTQNNGDCNTCSLVNYGLDCRNKPIGQGGPGRGQGRKPTTERGGLVNVHLQLFADQASRLKAEGNVSWLIRAAVDLLISELDRK